MSRDRNYIAVDKDQVMRCKWCGTATSEHWTRTERGTYCSLICETADAYNAFCILAFPILWISTIFGTQIIPPTVQLPADFFSLSTFLGVTFMIFVGCPWMCVIPQQLSARDARSKVAKNSRRYDRIFDERYLKCMNCNAPLDVDNGMTSVECPYCGTMNRVSYS